MWKMLKHIAQTHRKRLIGTFSLVGLENLLMLVYPVFGGRAINAVIAGGGGGRRCCTLWLCF